jgi:DNA topoisomerase-3
MRLFIAEKKGLGEVIALALGNGVNRGGYIECGTDVVTWGSGHLLELVKPESHNPLTKNGTRRFTAETATAPLPAD